MRKFKFVKMYDKYGIPMWAIDASSITDRMVQSIEETGTYLPEITHVIFNRGTRIDESHVDPETGKKVVDASHEVDVTVVEFEDGTKTIVKCSASDTPDRQTALTNAIAKKIFGKANYKGLVEGNGTGIKLRKIAEEAFDQANFDKTAAKAKTKAEHDARQKAAHDAAYAKKVKAEAEKMKLVRDAVALLEKEGIHVISEHKCSCNKNSDDSSYKTL